MHKFFLAALVFFPSLLFAQTNASGTYINPKAGDRTWRVDVNVNGNQVESIVTNFGTIGKGNESVNQAGVWPKGTGHGHLHQMSGWIGSRVTNPDNSKTVIISDGYSDSNTGPLAETDGKVEWKFQPKPDYLNRTIRRPEIANSLNGDSWPTTWPGKDSRWNGLWNGFFGLNQFNADMETYFVMDDWTNREFKFYPFGQANPDKRGLGMQVDVRLFQWSQALAKDILFMQYEVSNVGNTNFTNNIAQNPLFFGGYTDANPSGSGATDDAAAFDKQQDIVYGWSSNGLGTWTQFREIAPGYVGWKYLESPSISNDALDNDTDGLIDESRDNAAGNLITGSCGIYDTPREHWQGDEDCDWVAKIDDKGTDGIGPDEEGYPGKDPDGTEGNGKPDQGEPNFGKLDKDESDQIGLTSFYAPLFGTVDIKDEDNMWQRMQPGFFDVPQQSVNQIWIFASGPFNLQTNRTERFSTAFLWGGNEDALFRSSQVAQRIYDADYRFARPPKQPVVKAIPADGKVTLVWDDLAELSRDPIYGRDFEGYRILKSTDPQFRDAQDITDARGNAVYKRGIAQFDKVNGLKGPHPLQFGQEINLPNGVHFDMGDDTGLKHVYVDDKVTNGRTYYYAVLAYDAGYDVDFFKRGISDTDKLFPVSPSESPATITLANGVIVKYDRNTTSATPNPPPTDIEAGNLKTQAGGAVPHVSGVATGSVKAITISGNLIKDNDYKISFAVQDGNSSVEYATSTYTITDKAGKVLANKTPVPRSTDGTLRTSWTHELINEGVLLQFDNDIGNEIYTRQNSKWLDGVKNNLVISVESTPQLGFVKTPLWPINAVIEVTSAISDTSFTSASATRIQPTFFKIYEEGTNKPIDFILNETLNTRNGKIDTTETIQLAFKNKPDDARYSLGWTVRFKTPTDAKGAPLSASKVVLPQVGDKFVIRTKIPFGVRDQYTLQAVAATKKADLGGALDKVVVVPNPYIVGNTAENRAYLQGRGERKIFFRNLPDQCRIRIFSASGVFLRELEGKDGLATWDLQTKDGLEASFGLYFFHVRAEGIGEKVGKFAIVN